ncbi:hypothetical protein F5Y11DRAFT_158174 [Daldinia sp. FL1419]|nr:hypothetical protein F5Y11DRAFT_158174 [Daldinia sp. FL1419]
MSTSSRGCYIPPFRRGDAQASRYRSDASDSSSLPPTRASSSQYEPSNSEDTRGDMSDRGSRGRWNSGRRGRGRGRGTYNSQSSEGPSQRLQNLYHDVDVYESEAILKYFNGEEDGAPPQEKPSTFHDSKEHPNQLSYVLLFIDANPRWADDHIIFVKSNLGLLPEYSTKKAEHGEWSAPNHPEGPQALCGTANDNPKEETSQTTAQDKEADHLVTATESLTVADGEKTETTKSSDTGDNGETSAAEISSGSRAKYSDVRNLPPEEQERIVEEQNRRRIKLHQLQVPIHPTIPPIDYVPSTYAPIAVFQECRSFLKKKGKILFTFAGWYRITRINILAPHSAELVRMQQQKWERSNPHGEPLPGKRRASWAWKAALGMEWAVVQFGRINDKDAPADPAIETVTKCIPKGPTEAVGGRKGEDKAERDSKEDVKTKEDVSGKVKEPSVSVGDDGKESTK